MQCRSFLNSDLSAIVGVWNSQSPIRGRLAPITPDLLEQYVFAKPYFDPHGMIVAVEDRRAVGFVHAGFAIGERPGELDRTSGLICMLMLRPEYVASGVGEQLIREAEAYLLVQGATEIHAGAVGERAPYYMGLYGGSKLPGVLASDQLMTDTLRQAGYVEHWNGAIFQRELAGFRPPVERQCMPMRRQFRLAAHGACAPSQWYEACSYCWNERCTFTLEPCGTGPAAASLTFWDMEPLASALGLRALGLLDVGWNATPPNVDVLVFFLGETMRQLSTEGISVVEVQAEGGRGMLFDACQRLGFHETDRGIQYRKPSSS